MQNKKSGNGVKVAKVVEEVTGIINSSLTYPEKCKQLLSFETDRRPGKADADNIISLFTKKYNDYKRNTLKMRMKKDAPKLKVKWHDWANNLKQRVRAEVGGGSYYEVFDNVFGQDIGTYAKEQDLKAAQKELIFEARKLNKEYEAKRETAQRFTKGTGLSKIYEGKERSIFEVQENKASNAFRAATMYCKIQDYYITVTQTENEDWEAYSKSWHNAHGPKRTIESREINFYKNGAKDKTVFTDSFAGNYLIKAIVQFFNLKKVKVSKELKKVQLINEAEVIFIRKIQSVRIYKRTIAGALLDYCAIYKNETYHAASIQDAVKGLIRKAKAHISEEFELIDKKVGYQLGFCESGIKSFCDDNSLDFEGEYTRKELRNVVVKNRQVNCEKYKSELSKLKIFINC